MKNQTSLLRWAGLCTLALVVFVSSGNYAAGATETKTVKADGRADVVTIDAMAADGKLQLPPVTFMHDQHTKALAGKDCSTCHKPANAGEESSLSFRYMGADGVKGEDLKTLYHKNCIGCHTDMAKAGTKTGPLEAECRSCHNPRPAANSSWHDIGFDKVLHYKHVASAEITYKGDANKNCGACHHVFDASSQKLVWAKDKEDSCRACHMLPAGKAAVMKATPDKADENGPLAKRATLDVASHQACINCHLSIAAKKRPELKTGPVDCAGCHGTAIQTKLKEEGANDTVVSSIPRLERGQPDAVLMLPVADKEKELKTSMRPVSFNHKFHENVTMDCRSCHHKKITACSSCHSLEGKAEGDFVPLSMAMHKQTSDRSCVGCHNQKKETPSCAGCHASLPKGMTKSSCQSCHSTPVGVSSDDAENGSLFKLGKEERNHLADATVAARDRARAVTYDQADIPEKVTIGILSKDFEPSEFPHRKIVNTLMEKQDKSRLAAAFHTDKATLCQGCHHNSPPSKTPPKCVSCHGTDVRSAVDGRPSLKAAYHLQCMTCHARMDQKPAASQCADCHKPRGN